MLRWSRSRKSS